MYKDNLISIKDDLKIVSMNIGSYCIDEAPIVDLEICINPKCNTDLEVLNMNDECAKLLLEIIN